MIRYVHDVATSEFLNIGVLLLCPARRYAGVKFLESWTRITGAFPNADPVHLRRLRDAIQARCEVWMRQGEELPFDGPLSVAQLVTQAVPFDDASILLSPPLSGLTADPERTLQELFTRHVGRYQVQTEPVSRDDHDVWRAFEQHVQNPSLLKRLEPRTLVSEEFSSFRVELDHTWKNGMWHAAQPVSFDLTSPRTIQQKAAAWATNLAVVRPRAQDVEVTLLIGLPSKDRPRDVRHAAEDGLALLDARLRQIARALPEEQGAALAQQMERDLEAHAKDSSAS